MQPTTVRDRYSIKEDNAILEEDTFDKADDGMSDEDLKIESLKIATNICKLMNNVLPEDIIAVAEKVATFIKNGAAVTLEKASDETEDVADDVDDTAEDVEGETSDFDEDFSTEDTTDETPADESVETEEDFEV